MIDNIFLDPDLKLDGKTDDEIIAEWEEYQRMLAEERAETQEMTAITPTLMAKEVTDAVAAHDILREYLDTVLPKVTEMASYFPELVKLKGDQDEP